MDCEWQVGEIIFHEMRTADRREIVGIGEDGLTWRYIGYLTYERFDGEPNIHETHDTDDPWLSSENGWRRMNRSSLTREEFRRLAPREQLDYLRARPALGRPPPEAVETADGSPAPGLPPPEAVETADGSPGK